MNEFIKKLIEGLEEIPVENTCSDCPHKEKCDEVQENITDETTDLCGATIKALAIEIVNQLAEEYNNDVCEWNYSALDEDLIRPYHHKDSVGMYKQCLKSHPFCSYCGKKIKVVE